MTEGQAADIPRKRKGLLAFYVSTGFLALLFVAFYFAWTPLRVWYREREVLKAPDADIRPPRVDAARKLADIGPASYPAFKRLFHDHNAEYRCAAVLALRKPDDAWALPLLAEVAQDPRTDGDRVFAAAFAAVSAERILGMDFDRQRPFLSWWQREGKAKYGRDSE